MSETHQTALMEQMHYICRIQATAMGRADMHALTARQEQPLSMISREQELPFTEEHCRRPVISRLK